MTMLWGYGGIEKYMLNIFDHIDRTQYTFDVALPGNFKQQNEDALIERGINVIHYSIDSIGQQVNEIKRILNDGDYDVVHVMQSYVTLETYAVFALVAIAEQKRYRYKIICHSHGTEDKTKPIGPLKKALRSVYRALLRKGFSNADMVAGCSREAGEFLYGKNADIKIFYNGINLERFTTNFSNREITEIRDKCGIRSGSHNFAIVARMSAEKNPIFVLDVIKCLCRYYPSLNFVWVGDGELRSKVERHIKDRDLSQNVQLLGKQNNVEEILACCDYFLLPSKLEGAPLVLIEAQAAGLKCFASDRVPNIINCGGVSFIELDRTAEDWATEIRRQIECEPKAKINMDLLKRFDANETVKALSEVYDRLVET